MRSTVEFLALKEIRQLAEKILLQQILLKEFFHQ